MSTIRQREGDCRAFSKDSSCYSLARECYQGLVDAWMAGRAFYTGRTIYDAPLTIKLACIEGVLDCSPESVARADEDAAEEKKQEMLNGGDT